MCAVANRLFSVVFVVLASDPGNSDLFPFKAWSPPKITGPSGRKNSQQKCVAGMTDMARMVTCGSILKALLLLIPSPSLSLSLCWMQTWKLTPLAFLCSSLGEERCRRWGMWSRDPVTGAGNTQSAEHDRPLSYL